MHVISPFARSRIRTLLELQSLWQVSYDLPRDTYPLGYELNDSSLCHHYLFTWVQALTWIFRRKRINICSASRDPYNFVPRRSRNRIHGHHCAVILHPPCDTVFHQPSAAISLRCKSRTPAHHIPPHDRGGDHLHQGPFRVWISSHWAN